MILFCNEACSKIFETQRKWSKFEDESVSIWRDRVRFENSPTCKWRETIVLKVEELELALVIREDILDHGKEALISQGVVSEIQRSWSLQLSEELVEEELNKRPLIAS